MIIVTMDMMSGIRKMPLHSSDCNCLFNDATVFDAKGKAVTREVVSEGAKPPNSPEGGKVKLAPLSRIVPNDVFGYRAIIVERPLRDEQGKIVLGTKGKQTGKPQADVSLRETENVPLSEEVDAYFRREVLPYAPDAWVDEEKTKVGYEISFNRHFYIFEPPRSLAEIDSDLKQVTNRIKVMIDELSA